MGDHPELCRIIQDLLGVHAGLRRILQNPTVLCIIMQDHKDNRCAYNTVLDIAGEMGEIQKNMGLIGI